MKKTCLSLTFCLLAMLAFSQGKMEKESIVIGKTDSVHRPPFPICPSLPPSGVAATPRSLAVADSLASKALHLLNLVSALHPLALIAARGGHDYACAETLYWRALGLEPNNAALRPRLWVIANHKKSATIGWSPIPKAAEYRLVVEPLGASAGLIQQFSVKGSIHKYRFSKLRTKGAYQIYLTALSDKGVEIETLEYTFHL